MKAGGKNLMSRKKIANILKKCFVLTLALLMFSEISSFNTSTVSADTETSPFYSTEDEGVYDNLFYVDGLGDLYVATIRMKENDELAFCVSKQKYFPTADGIEYSTTDTWTWTLNSSGNTVTETQAEQIKNVLYNYHFVFPSKLTDYGLDADDTMSLYVATSITLWAIAEGFTPSDIKIKTDATSSEIALAQKQLALIIDLYNSRNTSTTYVSGGRLVNADDDYNDADDTIDVTTSYVYVIDGQYYYRSPLLSLVPNQTSGYVYQGINAYTYTVTLADTTTGAFIADANGNKVDNATFGYDVDSGSRFYVYIPATSTAESLTVNVETTSFSRMDLVLWMPGNERYQAIVKDSLVEDTASDTVTLTWETLSLDEEYIYETEELQLSTATISVYKEGYAVTGHTETGTDYGTLYTLNWSNTTVPLEGVSFNIISGSVFTFDDEYIPINAGFTRYNALTSSSGTVTWTNLPVSQAGSTTYRILEVASLDGYTTSGGDGVTTYNLQDYVYYEVTVSSSTDYTGSITIQNDPITFSFELQKVDQYGEAVAGAVFGLYTTEEILTNSGVIPAGSLVGIYTTDENGIIFATPELPATQDYILVELEAPEGYYTDSTELTVKATEATSTDGEQVRILNEDGNEVTIFTNFKEEEIEEEEEYTLTLNIIKTDSTTGELLAGAEFTLYYQDDEDLSNPLGVAVTNENGMATFTGLEIGAYVVYETSAPSGYVKITEAVINNDWSTGTITSNITFTKAVSNDPIIIIVPNTSTKNTG